MKLVVVLMGGTLLGSVTFTLIVFVPGNCAVELVHVNSPVTGSRFKFVKVCGGETSAKVIAWAGKTLLVAEMVTSNVWPA